MPLFRRQLFSDVFLVTNADKYKYFERWATASDFPVENIINDGSTTPENSIGAVADFELVLRTKKLWEYDVLVVAGDMVFQVSEFCIFPSGTSFKDVVIKEASLVH